jgi:hypothetical protein
MRKMIIAATMLLAAGISAAAAKASGAQATPSTKTPTSFDPCALMTKQEAAAAVGEAVGEPKPIAPGRGAMPGVDVTACEYESATKHSVQVSVWRFSESAGQFRQFYQAAIAKKERAPGLGDIASWYNAEHRELQVLKGSTLLIFEIHRSGNATEALTTAAKKALARLP